MGKFVYFAFGSNLLAQRLRKSCPSAEFLGCGRLDDHYLCFWNLEDGPSTRWQGATATISPKAGEHLWGALWEINESEAANLDKQEAIALRIYERCPVTVEVADGSRREALTYRMVEHHGGQRDCLPSPQYLLVIREGAKACRLPADYLQRLDKIKDNGFRGNVNGMARLDVSVPADGEAQLTSPS